jgi:hypothetical protein
VPSSASSLASSFGRQRWSCPRGCCIVGSQIEKSVEERDARHFLGSVLGSSLTSCFETREEVADGDLDGLDHDDDDPEDDDTEVVLLNYRRYAGSWRHQHGRLICATTSLGKGRRTRCHQARMGACGPTCPTSGPVLLDYSTEVR